MSVQIRQEINIVDAVLTATSGGTATSNEIVQLDTTQYVSPTYYFEIVADTTLSITDTVTLRRKGTTTDDATCTIPLGTTAATRIRSASFSPPAGQTEYVVFINTSVGANTSVKAARIIIIDNPATLTSTETQIEVGGQGGQAYTSSIAVPVTNPKYWLYTAANWNGTKTFFAEVTNKTASTNTATITLQEDNGSFASFVDKVTIVSAVSNTTTSRTRSVAFTPTDGRHYRVAVKSSTSKSSVTIYNAKVIVDQVGSWTIPSGVKDTHTTTTGYVNGINGIDGLHSSEALGFNFTAGSSYSCGSIGILIQKAGAPADNVYCNIRTTSITGTIIGTSDNLSATYITAAGGWVYLNFASPVALTSGTTYYVDVNRTGSWNSTNNYLLGRDTAATNGWSLDAATGWTNTFTNCYQTYTGAGGSGNFVTPSLLEPQYLLLNTVNTGTGLQAYQTLVDKTEWSGVTLAGKHAMDSNNASNAAKLVDITNANTDVTSSTVTGANQQISANIWANITTGHQIDVNITNSTGAVAGSRIIVAASPLVITNVPASTLLTMGVG